MDKNLRDNDDVKIKRISINGMNLKDLLKDEFVAKLDGKFENYTLYGFSLILDGEKPSKLVSLGHELGGDYKNNVLTISADSEENLLEFLELLWGGCDDTDCSNRKQYISYGHNY